MIIIYLIAMEPIICQNKGQRIPAARRDIKNRFGIFRKTSNFIFRQLSKYIVTPVFKALNDETRRKILQLLKERDMTAGEISERFAFSKPTISHHLDLLRQAGLVLAVKKGQFIHYSLNTTVIDDIVKWFFDLQNPNS